MEAIELNSKQANQLVNRIAKRTKFFNYNMSKGEKMAMIDLLSECFDFGSSIDCDLLAEKLIKKGLWELGPLCDFDAIDLITQYNINVIDVIDVKKLADNYAINAEIVTPEEAHNYNKDCLQDALFTWNDKNGLNYCLSW